MRVLWLLTLTWIVFICGQRALCTLRGPSHALATASQPTNQPMQPTDCLVVFFSLVVVFLFSWLFSSCSMFQFAVGSIRWKTIEGCVSFYDHYFCIPEDQVPNKLIYCHAGNKHPFVWYAHFFSPHEMWKSSKEWRLCVFLFGLWFNRKLLVLTWTSAIVPNSCRPYVSRCVCG